LHVRDGRRSDHRGPRPGAAGGREGARVRADGAAAEAARRDRLADPPDRDPASPVTMTRIALAQFGAGLGEVEASVARMLAFVEPARMLALQGARVLLVPMAWEVRRSFVLEKVAAARAVENVAYLVCVNQCGDVGPFRFHGGSRVIDPLGDAVAMLGNEDAL